MRRSTRISFTIIIALLGLVTSCEPTPTKQPGEVLLKTWVVFGTDPDEVLGRVENKGCRFSRAEIEAFITQLKSQSTKIFGTAAFKHEIELDPQTGSPRLKINEVESETVGFCPPVGHCDRRADQTELLQKIALTEDHWELNHLNIYFCGWTSPDATIPEAEDYPPDFGLTHDPRDAANLLGDIRYSSIIINDASGTGILVPQLLSGNILEHEVGHYLLDRRNAPGYDQNAVPPIPGEPGEHVHDGAPHLMDAQAPHPDSLPSGPGGEKREARDRILNGSWTGAPP